MRKVKITKQQTVNPKALFMGLSIKQMIIMGAGIAAAIGTLVLCFFLLGWNIDLTMTIVFIELVLSAGFSIIRINGMSLFGWIYKSMQSPIFRPYQSKGAMDKYAKENEKLK